MVIAQYQEFLSIAPLVGFNIIVFLLSLGFNTLFSFIGIVVLRLQSLVSFRKVIVIQIITLLILGLINGLFGLSGWFMLPIQIRPALASELWSVNYSYLSDPLGLVNWGYIIHIPYYWIVVNLTQNIIPAIFLFFATKRYLGLTRVHLYSFWLFLLIPVLSISLLQ